MSDTPASRERTVAVRDIDKPGYPLPIDPVSGMAWWRFNALLCGVLNGWSGRQAHKSMGEIIPVLRWLIYAPTQLAGATKP